MVFFAPSSSDMPLRFPENVRSEEHTSELQSRLHLVCRLLLEKKKKLSSSLMHEVQALAALALIDTMREHIRESPTSHSQYPSTPLLPYLSIVDNHSPTSAELR